MTETGYIYIIKNLTGEGTVENKVCSMLSDLGFSYSCCPTSFESVYCTEAELIRRDIAASSAVIVIAPSVISEDLITFSLNYANDAGKPVILFSNDKDNDLAFYSHVQTLTVIDADAPDSELLDKLFVKTLCKVCQIQGTPELTQEPDAVSLASYGISDSEDDEITAQNVVDLAKKAHLNDAYASYLLALEYLSGELLPQCSEDAVYWLERSSELGCHDAMRELGVCLLEGKGIEKNPRAALKYFLKSTELGDPQAHICLGDLYSDVDFEGYDPESAYKFYNAAASYALGDGYFKAGCCLYSGFGCSADPYAAFEYFSKGAEGGNIDCIYYLGMCYEYGEGCEADAELAIKYYREAANLGQAGAKNNLGGCYLYGFGVPADPEIAFGLFNEAEQLGNVQACCRAGICLAEGIGCEKNEEEAVEYYIRAADQNEPVACVRLARCYEKGVGTEQNYGRAFEYYEKAALLGDAEAMFKTAQHLLRGRGVKKNAWQAYKWFDSAAEAGLIRALYEVANCYFEGVGTVRNYREAFKKYLAVTEADPDCHMAFYRLGICYLNGLGTEASRSDAFRCFKQSAQMGNRDAMLMAGECCLFGVGTEKNTSLAVRYYKNSSELGNITATMALAECFEYGCGVSKDSSVAYRLYKKAADADSSDAMYNTGRCIMSGIGVQKDYGAARIYLLRAARKEHITAMLCLGIAADEGLGIPQNPNDAIRWYTKAATAAVNEDMQYVFAQRRQELLDREHDSKIEAQFRLGMIVAKNKKHTHNYIEAFDHIAGAASMGYLPAEHEVTRIYRHGGELKSYFESSSTDKLITPDERSVADAMNKLGDTYFDGKSILNKNEAAAARCYRIAAELGQNDARYSLGWCLRHGVGVKENDVEAVKWLKLSADAGNKNAAFSYGLCCEEGLGTGVKNKRDAIAYYRRAAADGHVEAAKRYNFLMESRFNN